MGEMGNVTVEIVLSEGGILEAYVIINGRRTVNLLSSATITIDDARLKVQRKLRDYEITWIGLQPQVTDAGLIAFERETTAMRTQYQQDTINELREQLRKCHERTNRQSERIRDLLVALRSTGIKQH